MSTINSPGIGSGLDVTSLVTAMVNAEMAPRENRLERQESGIKVDITAFGTLQSSMIDLRGTLAKLQRMRDFNVPTVSSSASSIATATATSDAEIGNYTIEVQNLAKAQSNATSNASGFVDGTSTVGGGTLIIELGSYSAGKTTFTASKTTNISINADATLTEVKNAINNAEAGVKASIIKDGAVAYLVMTGENTGADNAFKVTVASDQDGNDTDDAGLSALTYDPTTGGIINAAENIAAEDSQVVLNGLSLTQSSNTLKNAIDGLTIELHQESATTASLSVKNDTAPVKQRIVDFVGGINGLISTIKTLTSYDKETGETGSLFGDSTVRSIESKLRNLFTQDVKNLTGSYTSLVDLGLTVNEDGTVTLDTDTLDAALTDDFLGVSRLFAFSAQASDPLVEVESVSVTTKPGVYDLNLTAVNLGSNLAGTIDGVAASSDDGYLLEGSGDFLGLSLTIKGGSTGARGNISVTEGLGVLFDDFIDSYVDGVDGVLTTKLSQLNDRALSIKEDKEGLEELRTRIEARYLKQFTALDAALAKMQSTSAYLSQQLAGMSTKK